MARVIALVNQKGGVGKTTSTINVGAALHRAGKRVLMVDLDPQGNLTVSVGIEAYNLESTIFEVLKGDRKITEATVKRGYDVVPADIRLSGADMELSAVPGREMLLKEALQQVASKYDYILIDCPPSLGLITLNGLTAAQEIFIPLQAEFLALNGMAQLLNTVKAVQKRLNPQLEVTGIITTLYDSRKNLNKEVLEKIQQYFPNKTFKTLIRDNVALAEAPSFGQDIFEYRPDSAGAKDYAALCEEIISQETRVKK
jgi:chromosome partitioning protein